MGTNPIIDIARESWDSHDAYFCASEWLFQMARLWTEHQSPDTGTFPIDYRDPSGPATYIQSQETGEDSAYWEAVGAILTEQGLPATPAQFEAWADGLVALGYNPHRAMRHIMQATAILDRIARICEAAS